MPLRHLRRLQELVDELARKQAETKRAGKTGEILLAERDTALASTMSRGLRRAGYNVATADTLAGTWEKVRSPEPPDLLIASTNVFGPDIAEFATEITDGFPDLPLVLTAAACPRSEWTAGLPAGLFVLVKPFSRQELLSHVRAHIG